MSLKEYRMLDLLILSVLAILAEIMGIWLHGKFPAAGYYISFSTLIAIIAELRWGRYGAVVYCMTAIPITLFSETVSVQLFLFYIISNCAVSIVPLVFKRLTTSQIIARSYWLLGYILSFNGVLILSRGVLGFMVGLSFPEAVLQTTMQHLFSMIMSYLILILIKNREGLLVDMTSYFKSEKERKNEVFRSKEGY